MRIEHLCQHVVAAKAGTQVLQPSDAQRNLDPDLGEAELVLSLPKGRDDNFTLVAVNTKIQNFISQIKADNLKLRIWRAFSGIFAPKSASNGDLDRDVIANAALTNSMSVRPEVSKGGIKEIARDNNALRYLRANGRSGGDSTFTVGIKDIMSG